MIISISGYAGTGKDTAGQMIQYVSSRADERGISFDQWRTTVTDFSLSQWEIKKWAGKLKMIAACLTGISIEKFEDQEFKKAYLGPEWSRVETATNHLTGEQHVYEFRMTVRDFLQRLGTDGLRDGLHTNTWVNALMADYHEKEHTYQVSNGIGRVSPASKWIITDTRFPNELAAVKERKGITIRIERPGIHAVNAHPSETALDDAKFDYVIQNGGSIQDLQSSITHILYENQILW